MTGDILDTNWDVIVIGTGIGGGTIGRALAEGGARVLFIEKGPRGYGGETPALNHDIFVPEARLARRLWPAPLSAEVDGQNASLYAPLGAGVGGSSTFYAATLERPAPHDLDHTNAYPHPTGGWPISYADFAPWLDRAEGMFEVHGDPLPGDPHPSTTLRPPHPIQPGDQRIIDRLRRHGQDPYRLHAAIRPATDTTPEIRLDGRTAGVDPALKTGRAAILTRTTVTRLISDGSRITAIEARRDHMTGGETLSLTAPHIVLASGALGSAMLCLGSASDTAPGGIANSSNLIGRGLMFHLNELFALWPGGGYRGPSKSVGLRDLYHLNGQRMGMVQAMGVDASYGEILWYLRSLVDRSWLRHIPLSGQMARIPAAIAAQMLGHAAIFVGLLEDLPYDENRVLPPDPDDPDHIRVTYHIHDELRARRRQFRRAISRAFRGQRRMFLGRTPELNFGHPCGTMRMGHDPAKSVLRPDGRSHDLSNLWGADAGFFPTSMGVNPSLTIAAQALRSADAILKELQNGPQ